MDDEVLWLLVAAGVLFLISRNAASSSSTGFQDASMAAAYEADLLGSVSPRNVVVANQSQQPSFQGGTRSPSNIQTSVDVAVAGFPMMF